MSKATSSRQRSDHVVEDVLDAIDQTIDDGETALNGWAAVPDVAERTVHDATTVCEMMRSLGRQGEVQTAISKPSIRSSATVRTAYPIDEETEGDQ